MVREAEEGKERHLQEDESQMVRWQTQEEAASARQKSHQSHDFNSFPVPPNPVEHQHRNELPQQGEDLVRFDLTVLLKGQLTQR